MNTTTDAILDQLIASHGPNLIARFEENLRLGKLNALKQCERDLEVYLDALNIDKNDVNLDEIVQEFII